VYDLLEVVELEVEVLMELLVNLVEAVMGFILVLMAQRPHMPVVAAEVEAQHSLLDQVVLVAVVQVEVQEV
tara:strand:+ start:291 stop:503 length:213 start_codon:yes stop_codon:yes gene_type:complete